VASRGLDHRPSAGAHYRITPKKVSPADNLPATIRSAWRPPGLGGFLPVNYRPGETFLGSDLIMVRLFYGAGDRVDISIS